MPPHTRRVAASRPAATASLLATATASLLFTATASLLFAALGAILCAAPAQTRADSPRRVTRTPEHSTSLNPTLSGDGRRVAFESTADLTGADRPRQFRAFVADVSGESQATFAPLAASRAPAPSLSQDGSRAAFASAEDLTGGNPDRNSEIFLSDGATLRQLTDTRPRDATTRAPDGNFRPSISDDGRLVAFDSNRDPAGRNADGNSEIFLFDTTDGTLQQLTDTSSPLGATDAKLSGDGSTVAFIRNVGAQTTGGEVAHAVGNKGTDAVSNKGTHAIGDERTRAVGDESARAVGDKSSRGNGDEGTLSDDGEGGLSDDGEPAPDLVLFDLASRTSRVVAGGRRGLRLTPGRAMSDDGRRVVYSAEDASGTSQVFLFDGRNGLNRQLTSLGRRASDVPLNATISGDGSRIAFATRRAGVAGPNADASVELYLYDLPTAQFTRVTNAPADATAEVVSSLSDDGALAAFNFPRALDGPTAAEEFANNSEIFLAHLPARSPFSNDLEVLHGAALGNAPADALAPGQIAIARGTNLSLASARAQSTPGGGFPRTLGGATVTVNGRAARLFFVSPTQINFQIPEATETGAALVSARNHDGHESRAEVSVVPSAPGLFTEGGTGRGAAVALDADTLTRGPFDPADAANNPRRLTLYATGLGGARDLKVSIASRDATVEAVLQTPELPGLEEIHVLLRRSLAGAGVVPVRVTADGRASNEATLAFVGTRRAARVELTPNAAALGSGRALRLSARVFDADGLEIKDAPVAFASTDPSVVEVSPSGLARALRPGVTIIDATSGAASASAELRVHALTLVLNEALADPPDGVAGDANRDGLRSAAQDEFVEIVNASDADIDIGGHIIATRAADGTITARHAFAPGTLLAPGNAAVVFGGAAPSGFNPRDPAFGGALVLTASTGALSFANGGGHVLLLDPSGTTIEQLSYGGAGEPAGDRDQSLTRAPDVFGDFTPHLSAAAHTTGASHFAGATDSTGAADARPFSPGTRLDGSAFEMTAPVSRIEITPDEATAQVGATQQFFARAFGADGRELRGVIFRWRSLDPFVASIDEGGIARANAPGTASLVASGRGIDSAPARLTVERPPLRVARVEITPAVAALNRGATLRLSARAFDPQGRPVTDVSFRWSSANPSVASVDAGGLVRATGAGEVTFTAAADDGAGGEATASATLSVRVPLVLNELLADVPPDDAATAAVEGDANRDGTRNAGDDEFVELLNDSDAPVDLSGLRLSDSTGVRFTFPAGTVLEASRALVLFGGGSPPPADPAFGRAHVLRAPSLSLNDGGDTLTLKLPLGDTDFVVFTQTYGTQGGPPAPVDQSLTRTPDADADSNAPHSTATDNATFAPHLGVANAAGRPFSPGTRADGTPFASPPVARIHVEPTSASLDIGDSLSFNARAFASASGSEIELSNVSFSWDVSDPAKASLARQAGSSTDASARGAGVINVRARAGGREFVAVLTVKPPPPVLTRVEIEPQSLSLTVGQSAQLTARAFDQHGQPFPADSFDFASSQPENVTVDSIDFAHGAASATATITARRAGASQLTAAARAGAHMVASAPVEITTAEPPPFVSRIEVSPASASVGVGQSRQFAARAFDQAGREMSGVTFAWTTSDGSVASVNGAGLATGLDAGEARIVASASNVSSNAATLVVMPPPVPSPGEVVINEALVAFATSAAQPRADFVELFNTTDRALDISGLAVSFRAGGGSNSVRTVKLPGAVGSDTLRIAPRGYFLVVNGAQTFGASIQTTKGRPDGYDASNGPATETNAATGVVAPSACAATSSCLDLNNTTGGIKIEIGGVKLDGLSYQGGAAAPAAPFDAFGEGPLVVFTSGATNDLIRSPNAADTGSNAADFRRNGTASQVSPKAANP